MLQTRGNLIFASQCRACNKSWLICLGRTRALSLSILFNTANSANVVTRPDQKYKETVLLPRTSFPLRVEGIKRLQNELQIQKKTGFASLYGWQENQNRRLKYVLHDGPPYANGKPHIGHAVNKILKDITLRNKLLQGYQVHYRPGWDCHGLPIELKALEKFRKENRKKKIGTVTLDPLAIREKARQFAKEAQILQQNVFNRWGLLVNWQEKYKTMEPQYIKRQLQLFAALHEGGHIYQAFKPVYFSPSSGSALAEAELEYNTKHQSPTVYLALPVTNTTMLPNSMQDIMSNHGFDKVYLVIWTTTPWTLLANQAICYAEDKSYTLVKFKKNGSSIAVIWAEELLHELNQLNISDVEKMGSIRGSELSEVTYQHPLDNRHCPCIPAAHVTMGKGTGFVHTAPAHGHDDFNVALQHNLPLECDIDEGGRYNSNVGYGLAGKSVLDDGNSAILELLATRNSTSVVLEVGTLIHSYPYDWRTKKPVIIRASKQWFINTDKLKDKALTALSDVTILPTNIQTGMVSQLERRPYWCISRQRSWGAPIPVFYDPDTGDPIMDKETINHVAEVLGREGGDAWWKLGVEELLVPSKLTPYIEQGKQLPNKGLDILDIWFDSGSSWFSVLGEPQDGEPVADLYLEGVDQFTGWFQSSLLTATALTGKAPYKQIYVHGFTLDESGHKMSKSLGNVVDPETVTNGGKNLEKEPVYGADVLRWWVAAHSTNNVGGMTIGKKILDQSRESVQKVRSVIRFLLSGIEGFNFEEQKVKLEELQFLDQYMLHLLQLYHRKVWDAYENFQYHRVPMIAEQFINTEISAFYITCIRDRLYCEEVGDSKRVSCQMTLHCLLDHLLVSLAPVIPHLVEEAAMHHPQRESWRVFHDTKSDLPSSWQQPDLAFLMEKCREVRSDLYKTYSPGKAFQLHVTLEASGRMFDALQMLQSKESDQDSALCELLQVPEVTLQKLHVDNDEYKISVRDAETVKCLRCRRITAQPGQELCTRCHNIIRNTCL